MIVTSKYISACYICDRIRLICLSAVKYFYLLLASELYIVVAYLCC